MITKLVKGIFNESLFLNIIFILAIPVLLSKGIEGSWFIIAYLFIGTFFENAYDWMRHGRMRKSKWLLYGVTLIVNAVLLYGCSLIIAVTLNSGNVLAYLGIWLIIASAIEEHLIDKYLYKRG